MSDQEVSRIKAQARVLIDAGRFAEAATTLTHGLAAEPGDYELLCLMSQVMVRTQRDREAATYAEQAIAVQPEGDWGHRLRCFAMRNYHLGESLKSAKRAVEVDPQEPSNWHALASAELHLVNLNGARAAAEQMLALAPESCIGHQLLALVALKEKKYEEAEAHCRRELTLNPNSYPGMNNLGVALLNRGRKREAIEALNRAAKMDPSHELARRNLRIAADKSLPAAGIMGVLGFALWRLADSLDVGSLIWLVIALSVVAVVSFIVLQRQSLRQLPPETQNYLKSLNRWR
jgi:predicted Zn-dependent protease